MAKFTVFEYAYINPSDVKIWGKIFLRGGFKPSALEVINAKLKSGQYFIAEQLGIPPLYTALSIYNYGPNNVWHEFYTLRPLNEKDIIKPALYSVKKFISDFNNIKYWKPEISPHWDMCLL